MARGSTSRAGAIGAGSRRLHGRRDRGAALRALWTLMAGAALWTPLMAGGEELLPTAFRSP